VRKPEIKRPFERPRRRWEGNIKLDLQEVGCRGMNWIYLSQDSFSRKIVLHGVSKVVQKKKNSDCVNVQDIMLPPFLKRVNTG